MKTDMTKLELQQAQPEDFDRAMEILRSGRDFQRQQGFVQWQDHFPDPKVIRQDIESGLGYVVKAEDQIAAYFYLGFDGDPAYPEIAGKWNCDEPYGVIHRIALGSEFRGMGLSSAVFQLAEDHCRQRGVCVLRIDTHEDNRRMQHILLKNGFVYCGIVLQAGSERLAYEKKL